MENEAGGGALRRARKHPHPISSVALGPRVATFLPLRPTGGPDPPRRSWCPVAGCLAPTPRPGWWRTAERGPPVRAWRRTTGLHSRAHSAPNLRASDAVMEPRPIFHGGKRASCRCFEKPTGRFRFGPGSSCGGHSRVPFMTRRSATKPLPGRGGGGEQSSFVAVSHGCTGAAALRGSWRSCSSRRLRSSHTKSPSRSMWWRKSSTDVPPGGSLRAIERSCASAASGTSPEQRTSVHAARAERHEANHRALSLGGRWRAASCTAWQ